MNLTGHSSATTTISKVYRVGSKQVLLVGNNPACKWLPVSWGRNLDYKPTIVGAAKRRAFREALHLRRVVVLGALKRKDSGGDPCIGGGAGLY